MKYTIEAIENAREETTWKELGIHHTLGQAYIYSMKAGNELPNFDDIIWDKDIETILADCRRLGVKEFTISSSFSGLIETMARLQEQGCTLDGIVKIYEKDTHFGREEHDLIPAFKMTVR